MPSMTPPLDAPPYAFAGQVHQPVKKGFPVWGIVLIVLGIFLVLALCVVGTVVAVNEVISEQRNNLGSEWLFDDFNDEWEEEFRAMQEAELERLLVGIENDSSARSAIADSYRVTGGYFADGRGVFERDTFSVGDIYTFNADGTFEIPSHSDWGGPAVYEGEFVIERISADSFDAWDRLWMKDVDERADSDWYRLILHSANFEWEVWQDVYISWVSADDIMLYRPDFGESKIISPID